jgi:hypothetical protein
MADSPGMRESWSPPRALRKTSTTPTIRRTARTSRSNSGTIRISNISSTKSEALKRIEDALNVKLDALHGENAELNAGLEHTLSTLAKADNDREEQLKEISTQLKTVTTELHAIRKERNVLKAKLEETEARLHSKLGDMHIQINTQLGELETQLQTIGSNVDASKIAISNFQAVSTTSMDDPNTLASPPLSYASTASRSINPSSSATRPTTSPTSTGPSPPASPAKVASPPGLVLDTRKMKDKTDITFSDGEAVEKRIQDAITAQPSTSDIKIKGIQVKPNSIKIITNNEQEAATLRLNNNWINILFNGARAKGDDWHLIKVDDVIRNAVLVPGTREVNAEFGAKFSTDNNFTGVMKTYWISKGEKRTGSMVIHMASADDARRANANGYVKIGGNLAIVSEYQRVQRPQRCYKCNGYGHLRTRCTRDTTCGKCAGSHETNGCTATEPKCPACDGPHTVMDPGCPAFLREREKLRNPGALRQPRRPQSEEWQTIQRRQRWDVNMQNA